ncbi:MAG: hypothetical protein AAF525_22415, partial [Pseudomonadota bacterium]
VGDELRFNNVTVELDAGTTFSGTGLVALTGDTTWNVNGVVTLNSTVLFDNSNTNDLTIDGTGTDTLIIGPLQSFELVAGDVINVDLELDGALRVERGGNTIDTITRTGGASNLTVISLSTTQGNLTVADGFTNNGAIVFDQSTNQNVGAVLNISAGTLTNVGTITAQDTGGGLTTSPHVINGNLASSGTIDVDPGVILRLNAGTHSFVGGTLNIDGELQLNNTIQLGTGTLLTGGGIITPLNATQTIEVVSDYTLVAGGPSLQDAGIQFDYTGAGTLTVDSGTVLELSDGDSVTALLQINGTVLATGIGNVIDTIDSLVGSLDLQADATTADLTITNGFATTTTGTVTFDNATGSDVGADLTIAAGNLVNGSTLLFMNSGGGMVTDHHSFVGDFTNSGTFTITSNATVRFGTGTQVLSNFISIDGVLEVDAGQVNFDSTTTLTGTGTIVPIAANNFFGINGNVVLGGGDPDFDLGLSDVTFTGTGTLSVTGTYTLSLEEDDIVQSVLQLDGRLDVESTGNIINPIFTTSDAEIQLRAVSSTTSLLINDSVVMNGDTLLDTTVGTLGADLTTTGTFTNSGTFLATSSGGGQTDTHNFTGELVNGDAGRLLIETGLSVTNTGPVVNDGEIELISPLGVDVGATLSLAASNLVNNGLIATTDGDGSMVTGSHLINAEIIQGTSGLIDVQSDLTVTAAITGINNGTLNVAEGQTLSLNSALVALSDGTDLVGGGTIDVQPGTTFDLVRE